MSSAFLPHITVSNIYDSLFGLKSNTAPDVDNICTHESLRNFSVLQNVFLFTLNGYIDIFF